MTPDIIVEETRAHRREVQLEAVQAGVSLYDYVRQHQKAYAARLTARQPQPALRRKSA